MVTVLAVGVGVAAAAFFVRSPIITTTTVNWPHRTLPLTLLIAIHRDAQVS